MNKTGAIDNWSEADELCVNTIRALSMDAIQKANSGHPGAPMGLAAAGYVLWTRILKHNPDNPDWLDRDRFVLSGGHASMLLYSLLYLSGYDLSLDDIKNFRQWGSKTPGHPEFGHTPGVETTTGPLGQGFANAVGMAMAEQHLAATYNSADCEIVDHHTYVMCGDGDMMEGITSEAASLAGHLGLSRLICIYDDNKISIEGGTDISFTEDVAQRFKAYNWHVQQVDDGNDLDAIYNAVIAAKEKIDKPSLIMLRTHIAFGSPNKQDSADAHGSPLGEEEVRLAKQRLGFPETDTFYVPEQVLDIFKKYTVRGKEAESNWRKRFEIYRDKYSDLAERWTDAVNGTLKNGWDADLPHFEGSIATRAASGKVLNAIAKQVDSLIGGSADLAPSNKTIIESSHDFQKNMYDGRNIRFGVREHAMGAILSGMAIHKGLKPYGGTFLVFADYMRPSIRLACMMKLPVIYIFTHDSIAVGEDGPETAEAWRIAMKSVDGPVALILSRQKLPVLDRSKYGLAEGVANGAYILSDSGGSDSAGKPDIILIASGSEVHIALEAADSLVAKGVQVRVVNMPSWELFEKMPQEYKDKVLLPDVEKRIAVEAGIPMGWERYVGNSGAIIGITGFGVSAPGGLVMERFGFTPENIVEKAIELLGRIKG
jgi:transketolase